MIQHQQNGLIVFESALYRTTSSIYYNRSHILLVDPNWLPEEIDHIRSHIHRIKQNRILYILFTHSDYDHILAYEAFRGALVIASEPFVNNPDKDKQVALIRDFDDEYYINRDYPISYPSVDEMISQDGQKINMGSANAEFHLLPGHTRDGLLSIIPEAGIWFAGDHLSNIEFPFIEDSLDAYRNSLQKFMNLLATHKMEVMVPGHGDVCLDQEEMEKRIGISWDYLDMLERELDHPGQDTDWLWNCFPRKKSLEKAHQQNIEFCKSNREK